MTATSTSVAQTSSFKSFARRQTRMPSLTRYVYQVLTPRSCVVDFVYSMLL